MTLAPANTPWLGRVRTRVAQLRPRTLAAAALSAAAVGVLVFVAPSWPADTLSGRWETQPPVLVLGAIVGMTYGLSAAGLVLVYRTSRVINFAHAEVGVFAAALFGLVVVRWSVPYWLAFPVALGLGGLVAAGIEVLVLRRLRDAPKLMSIVATLGAGQFLLLFGFAINTQAGAGQLYPQPAGLPDFMLQGLRVSPAFSGMLLLSPLVVIGLGLFLQRTRYGVAIRGASDNSQAARLAGVFASRMSALAWGLAGVLAALTAILTQPTRGFTSPGSFGVTLLLMALAAGVLARMSSIPKAVVAGVGLGLLEQLLRWNYPRAGAVEVALFLLILVALLLQKQVGARQDERGSWAAVQAVPQLPDELRALWLPRNLGRLVGAGCLMVALSLPLFISNSAAVTLTAIFAYAVVALSLGVVTGLGGLLTLGQFAFAGLGAVVSYHVSIRTGWFPLAFLYGGLAAAGAAVLVGLPALRIRGLLITVTTLAFAVAAPAALFGHPWLLGDGVNPPRPTVADLTLDTGRTYYYVGLGVLLLAIVIARNVRASGFGRLLVSVRDNEDNARAFTVRATKIKVQGMAVGGFLAGIGGAVYGHSLSHIGVAAFPAMASIDIAKMAVIGGISMFAGPLLGAMFVMGVPAFLPLDAAGLAATSLGQLLIIMYLPKGLVQLVVPVRDRIANYLGRRAGIITDGGAPPQDGADRTLAPGLGPPDAARSTRVTTLGGAFDSPNGRVHVGSILEVRDLSKAFGGIQAVDQVTFDVRQGETLGLIGPNGAGKTTLFELVGGFTKPDGGRIAFNGRDITHLPAEERGRFGLIRSFQDAALFPTMTVEEAVMLACERRLPTRLSTSLLGVGTGEGARRSHARSIIAEMGLEGYRSRPIIELSTGTRRITELACLVALEPTTLLLDEPTSGIAQRETEALGALLTHVKQQLDMTLVVIEHDIPMIMGIADRVIAMADGRILAVGTPSEVRNDPQVLHAYLGGDATAIERSGELSAMTSETHRDARKGEGEGT